MFLKLLVFTLIFLYSLNKHTARHRFETTSHSFKPKLDDTIFSHFGQYQYFIAPVACLINAEQEMLLHLILFAKREKKQLRSQKWSFVN